MSNPSHFCDWAKLKAIQMRNNFDDLYSRQKILQCRLNSKMYATLFPAFSQEKKIQSVGGHISQMQMRKKH